MNWIVGFLLKYVVGKSFSVGPIAVDVEGTKLNVSANITVAQG